MKTYEPKELRQLLEIVDASLTESFSILIVGGAAAALGYGIDLVTRDIDTWEAIPPNLVAAFKEARDTSGLDIPVHHAAVADAPYEFESRLRPVELGNQQRLGVLVPEKHDLSLMKISRGYEHDLQTVQAIARMHGLDFEILSERYLAEMGHAIGDPRILNLKMLAAVERLFDEESVRRFEVKLER